MGEKRDKTLFTCTWHNCLCSKAKTIKLPELINAYIKAPEYKFNIQKSIAFLFTRNEQVDFELKTPFILEPQNETLRYNSNTMYKTSIWGKP